LINKNTLKLRPIPLFTKHILGYFALAFSSLSFVYAQQDSTRLIQVSGIVADGKAYKPMPFVNISVPAKYWGTSSSSGGFFTVVAGENDTIQFSFVGYKTKAYVVPDTLANFKASVVILMDRDTLQLSTVEIYPWPSKEAFKQAFLSLKTEENNAYKINPNAGFHALINPVVPAPTLMNPVSFFYENVIKEIKKRVPKKKRAETLPKME